MGTIIQDVHLALVSYNFSADFKYYYKPLTQAQSGKEDKNMGSWRATKRAKTRKQLAKSVNTKKKRKSLALSKQNKI